MYAHIEAGHIPHQLQALVDTINSHVCALGVASSTRAPLHPIDPCLNAISAPVPTVLNRPTGAWCEHLAQKFARDYATARARGTAATPEQHWAYAQLQDLQELLGTLEQLVQAYTNNDEAHTKEYRAFRQRLHLHQRKLERRARSTALALSLMPLMFFFLLSPLAGLTTGAAIQDGIDGSIHNWQGGAAPFVDLAELKIGALAGISAGFYLGVLFGLMATICSYRYCLRRDSETEALAKAFIQSALEYAEQQYAKNLSEAALSSTDLSSDSESVSANDTSVASNLLTQQRRSIPFYDSTAHDVAYPTERQARCIIS